MVKRFVYTFWYYFSFLILGLLWMLKPLIHFRFGSIVSQRIGHLSGNVEFFLRKQKNIPSKCVFVFFCRKPSANRQLLKMVKRRLRIVESNRLDTLLLRSCLPGTIFFQNLNLEMKDCQRLSLQEPELSFTSEEIAYGDRKLAEMGIGKNDWFVCISSRDSNYLKSHNPNRDWSYHDYRDCSILNYLEAADVVVSRGGYVLRMGVGVDPLPNLNSDRIIDYACKYRTDFMDIFLLAKCKFLIGSTDGKSVVAHIFNTPVIVANQAPLEARGLLGKSDIFVPKIHTDTKSGRVVPLEILVQKGAHKFLKANLFREAGIELIETSSKEIEMATKEMIEQLEDSRDWLPEDMLLQDKFRKKFDSEDQSYFAPNTVSRYFLRQYREELGL